MKRIFAIFAVLALAGISDARPVAAVVARNVAVNRAVSFRGGYNQQINLGSRYRQDFRNIRYVQPFYAQSFYQPAQFYAPPAQFLQPIQYTQPYTQGFTDPCGGAAYTQPFAQGYSQPFQSYQSYSQPYSAYSLGFSSGYRLPLQGGHGHGHHGPRPVAPFRGY